MFNVPCRSCNQNSLSGLLGNSSSAMIATSVRDGVVGMLHTCLADSSDSAMSSKVGRHWSGIY